MVSVDSVNILHHIVLYRMLGNSIYQKIKAETNQQKKTYNPDSLSS